MLLQILTYTHHLTTMLFGIFLSAFSRVKQNKKMSAFFLAVEQYPDFLSDLQYGIRFVVHGSRLSDFRASAAFLLLVFYYRFRWLPSIISIMTAYLCCQFSNWAGIFALSLSGLDWIYYLVRIIVTVAVFAFLSRYLCQTTALLFAKSDRELYILGAMPFVYYVFDYSTTKFSMLLYSGNKVVVEFLAFAMCISYVIFLFVYFQEYELKNRAEQYGQLTNMQLNSLHSEIEQVRSSEQRMKILRHDMRHHLAAIQTFISQQEPERALDYIQEINKQYDDTVIHSFCRNELLNSVLSIYQTRFAENQIVFDVQIQTSQTLCCSEMTFCAILSNLLENAMHAVTKLPEEKRIVHLSIFEKETTF